MALEPLQMYFWQDSGLLVKYRGILDKYSGICGKYSCIQGQLMWYLGQTHCQFWNLHWYTVVFLANTAIFGQIQWIFRKIQCFLWANTGIFWVKQHCICGKYIVILGKTQWYLRKIQLYLRGSWFLITVLLNISMTKSLFKILCDFNRASS